MKTPHLDNLINDLKAYDKNDMLSDNGRNQLNEYEAIKQALSIANVSGSALEVAKQIPQVPQTQMALNDQLKILRVAANKLGLYDAADFIRGDLHYR